MLGKAELLSDNRMANEGKTNTTSSSLTPFQNNDNKLLERSVTLPNVSRGLLLLLLLLLLVPSRWANCVKSRSAASRGMLLAQVLWVSLRGGVGSCLEGASMVGWMNPGAKRDQVAGNLWCCKDRKLVLDFFLLLPRSVSEKACSRSDR